MSGKSETRKQYYRVNLKLDYEQDADLIAWIMAQPRGHRSQAVREALRQAMQPPPPTYLEAIRLVVAEELSLALAGMQPVVATPAQESQRDNLEARFGGKLDRMLGSLHPEFSSDDAEERSLTEQMGSSNPHGCF